MPSDPIIDTDAGRIEWPDGSRVALTAAERRLLVALRANPDRILSRARLLDAVFASNSDSRDRNIDFLVGRLRRKLADPARAPRFIATRYGEGYVWIGGARTGEHCFAGVGLVVGPLLGLGVLDRPMIGHRMAQALHAAIAAEMPDTTVALAADCPPATQLRGAHPDHAVELTFQSLDDRAYCVICLRGFASGRVIATHRMEVGEPCTGRIEAKSLARRLAGELLNDRATSPARHAPLGLAMLLKPGDAQVHVATEDATRIRDILVFQREAERRNRAVSRRNASHLRALLAEGVQNAQAQLLLAATIHGRYMTCGMGMFADEEDDRARDEDEIEALVTEALPHLRSNPEHAVLAAQLLHFLGRGHEDLARDLAEAAVADDLFTPGGLAAVGQLRAYAGETEPALACLDQAIDLSPPGSNARTFATAIKCSALAAAARWDALREASRTLDIVCPNTGLMLEPMYCDPRQPTPSARALVAALSPRRASAMLGYSDYISARLFRQPDAGQNMLLPLTCLLTDRFGADIVPTPLRRRYPASSRRAGPWQAIPWTMARHVSPSVRPGAEAAGFRADHAKD